MGRSGEYNQAAARVHIVDSGATSGRLHCHRCHREMPIGFFKPVHWFPGGPNDWPKTALHPYCNLCREQEAGRHSRHPLYSPELDRFFASYLPRLRGGARSRSIAIAITKDDLLGLFLAQDGKCALSGIDLDCRAKSGCGRGGMAVRQPSVDRIDSGGHYTVDNIQIVSRVINIMKNDLSIEQFSELCRLVSEHSLLRDLDALAA